MLYFLIIEQCYLSESATITKNDLIQEYDFDNEVLKKFLEHLSKKGLVKIEGDKILCYEVEERLEKIIDRRKSNTARQSKHRGKIAPDYSIEPHGGPPVDLGSIDIPISVEVPDESKNEEYKLSDSDYKKLLSYIRLWNDRFHTDSQKKKSEILERTVIKFFKTNKIPISNISIGIAFMEESTEKIKKTNIADWATDGLFTKNKQELHNYFFKSSGKNAAGLTPYSQTGNPTVIPINQRLKMKEPANGEQNMS
jgi:hypothetical protein